MGKPKKPVDPAAREIGLRIARRSADLGMNQKELSIQADVPYQTISLIENGKRMPDTATLLKIAQALKVPLSALQPESLDQYGEMPMDILLLAERIKGLPPDQRKAMTHMFSAQIKSLPPNFTPT